MRRSLLPAVLSLSVLFTTLVAAQDASYTFTTFDVPGSPKTEAHGINAHGQIVGLFMDATTNHGFLKDGATFTTIDPPDATTTFAFGINAAGQIVGWFGDSIVGGTHGFLKDGATFTTIDPPGATYTEVYGINAAGQIVGRFDNVTKFSSFLATPAR
jgi:uncharacterized membrane protein